VLYGRRPLTQPYLLSHASPAQRAACVCCLVLHSFIDFLCSEPLLVVGKRNAHPFTDCVRIFALEREDFGQEGFNALVQQFSPLSCLQAAQGRIIALWGDRVSRH
jgi:hypothetical protein